MSEQPLSLRATHRIGSHYCLREEDILHDAAALLAASPDPTTPLVIDVHTRDSRTGLESWQFWRTYP